MKSVGMLAGTLALVLGGWGYAQPWALGEQPNFSGTVVNWAEGDAIAPGEGGIYAVTESMTDSEGSELGFGAIKADASFTFGLQKGDYPASISLPPTQALCDGFELASLSLSNPEQRVANVSLSVPALFEEGQHARPEGGVQIRATPPSAGSMLEQYGFIYASADGTVRGTCSGEGLSVAFDLDLRQGWNSVFLSTAGGLAFTTAAIPEDAKWYFVNPNTLAVP